MDNAPLDKIIGTIVAAIVFLYMNFAESMIMDALFSIIYDMADEASSYNPFYGTLIHAIPSLVISLISFGMTMTIVKKLIDFANVD